MPANTGTLRTVLITANGLDEKVGGFAIRWRSLHTALSRLGEVTVLPVSDLGSPEEDDTYLWPRERSRPQAEAMLVRRVASLRPDLVVITELRLGEYLRPLADAGLGRLVLDLHSVESVRAREFAAIAPPGTWWDGYYTTDRAERIRVLENDAVDLADQVWMCSAADADLIRTQYDHVVADKVHVVNNAIEVPRDVVSTPSPTRVVFTGLMDYLPNVFAVNRLVEDIAPVLAARLPGLTIDISGSGTPPTPLPDPLPTNVRLLGPFDRIQEAVAGGIMAVPMSSGGRGGRYKILEAFIAGVPVVSTVVGMDGVAGLAGRHFLRAERPEEFVDAFERLIGSADLRAGLVDAALTLVRDEHSIDAITESVTKAVSRINR
jgi:polysaccharide biosynthesis protein PslH